MYVDELGRMATDYDGSNDQVVLTGGFPDLYWYAFWLRYTSTSGTHTIINSVLSGSYTISLDHTRAQLSGGANNGPAASLDYIPVNVWTHIVIYPQLVNAGGVIFVNGVDRTVNATDYVGVADANCIGACSWRYFYLGRLADVLVWNRALAPAEIAALADTSNVMLEYAGVPLIGPRPRRWWPIGAAPPAGIPWVYAHSRSAAVIGAH
ncbi:MAG: hypothetical protein IMZ55_11480 [Acidobacteria bacterium]|nr:hypothetical protein [Acidobacteriota bacterium]